jgi:DNA topoisomerase-1
VYPCPCVTCVADYSAQSQVTVPKSEPATPVKSLRRKRAAPVESSSDDDDFPLASSPAKQSAPTPVPGTSKTSTANGHKAVKADSDSKRSTVPVKKKRASAKKEPPHKKLKLEPNASDPSASEGEESKPVKKEKAPKKRKSKAKEETDADAEDGETPKPMKKRATTKKVKDEANGSETPQPKKKKGKVKDEGEEEEEVYRWWEAQQNNDGEVKWQTLEHSGVIFPPPYESLPSDVKMRYKGMSPYYSWFSW